MASCCPECIAFRWNSVLYVTWNHSLDYVSFSANDPGNQYHVNNWYVSMQKHLTPAFQLMHQYTIVNIWLIVYRHLMIRVGCIFYWLLLHNCFIIAELCRFHSLALVHKEYSWYGSGLYNAGLVFESILFLVMVISCWSHIYFGFIICIGIGTVCPMNYPFGTHFVLCCCF